jgi:hypothetical protein
VTEPTVCCIMLTRDRPELAKRAVECFQRQTYANLLFFALDTGEKCTKDTPYGEVTGRTVWMPEQCGKHPIGALRNVAIKCALGWNDFDVIAHFDDDDWSHPNRVTEQVALLRSSGADVVGYNEMLFWRQWPREPYEPWIAYPEGEVFLYSGPTPRQALGTSLCYWRKTWEARPFNPQLPRVGPGQRGGGEDWEFLRDRRIAVETSVRIGVGSELRQTAHGEFYDQTLEPRMIARIHGGNSSNGYSNLEESPNWKRVPKWDNKVREILK